MTASELKEEMSAVLLPLGFEWASKDPDRLYLTDVRIGTICIRFDDAAVFRPAVRIYPAFATEWRSGVICALESRAEIDPFLASLLTCALQLDPTKAP